MCAENKNNIFNVMCGTFVQFRVGLGRVMNYNSMHLSLVGGGRGCNITPKITPLFMDFRAQK